MSKKLPDASYTHLQQQVHHRSPQLDTTGMSLSDLLACLPSVDQATLTQLTQEAIIPFSP